MGRCGAVCKRASRIPKGNASKGKICCHVNGETRSMARMLLAKATSLPWLLPASWCNCFTNRISTARVAMIVNAFAELEVVESLGATVTQSVGGKDLSDQRILT